MPERREFRITINLIGAIGPGSEEHIHSVIKDIKAESITLRTILQYMKKILLLINAAIFRIFVCFDINY